MKTPKVEKVNLPYASTVASFYGDQGLMQGNSFLSRVLQGNKSGMAQAQSQPNKAAAATARPFATPLAQTKAM